MLRALAVAASRGRAKRALKVGALLAGIQVRSSFALRQSLPLTNTFYSAVLHDLAADTTTVECAPLPGLRAEPPVKPPAVPPGISPPGLGNQSRAAARKGIDGAAHAMGSREHPRSDPQDEEHSAILATLARAPLLYYPAPIPYPISGTPSLLAASKDNV